MDSDAPYALVVIGGGAAGFFGALAFAGLHPGAAVCILEKAAVVLGKVRISGGGRCNVTHACFDPQQLIQFYPRGARELRGAFTRFQPRNTIEWFEERGIPLKTEADGRVFPVSNSSETIIACLKEEAERLNIEVRCHSPVTHLVKTAGDLFEINLRQGSSLIAHKVLLASGGDRGGFGLAQELGHTIRPPVPSLFTLVIDDQRLAGLEGISVPDAHISLPREKIEAHGPLLITHWGLSGPAVLRLSAWGARALFDCAYYTTLLVNWIFPQTQETASALFNQMRSSDGRRQVISRSPLPTLPLRLWKQLAFAAGINGQLTWANLPRKQLLTLVGMMSESQFEIRGKGQFKEEFVTCGGVALNEVDFHSMQSRKIPGLYLAGEVLDIDGLTGGFNFQNAWTTAWIAGQSIASQS